MQKYPISLSHFLSSSGVASRRKSTDLIKQGFVFVNKQKEISPGYKVQEQDVVEYKNKIISISEKVYIMLNKPVGYICTADDPYADKTIFDLIDIKDVRLFSVGRLDKNSEGLLLLTNDGDFSNKIMHPSNNIIKEYIIETNDFISKEIIQELEKGIKDEGDILRAIKIKRVGLNRYSFSLNEGKKREIRRMITYAGLKTINLKRIKIGSLDLGNLEIGKWKYLSKNYLQTFLIKDRDKKNAT